MSHLDYVKYVDSALKELGADPKEAKGRIPGSWIVEKGSGRITITLDSSLDDDGDDTLTMSSYIMDIPRKDKRILYRRMLELNRGFKSERFEIFQDQIYISSVRNLEGLTVKAVIAMVDDIADTVDFWDEKLIAEFGDKKEA